MACWIFSSNFKISIGTPAPIIPNVCCKAFVKAREKKGSERGGFFGSVILIN